MTKVATSTSKDVLYIDVDDEITAIIEKVTASKHKIIALVLPKRSTTLQSVVNMKLLQRTAASEKKNIVLVTTDTNLLPLAGAVGLHVAATPQSKPYIPNQPDDQVGETESVDEAAGEDDFDTVANSAVAVGALAAKSKEDEEEPIELDGDDIESMGDDAASVAKTDPTAKKSKKDKKSQPKVPNFNKFRNWLIIGGVVGAVLLGGAIYAFITMPYANVTIWTETKVIPNTLDVTFDTTAQKVSVTPPVVPAVVEKSEKSNSQTVPATGERNDGVKATGSVTMTVNDCTLPFATPPSVPAGTGVSTGGKNYITQETASFKIDDAVGGCVVYVSKNSVPIVAQAAGTAYNVEKATFTVAASDAKATGSASGGTDAITKIVTQTDIDNASKQLEAKPDTTTKDELTKKLKAKNLYVIDASYTTASATVSSSVPAGTVANEVTVTRKTTSALVGAKESDLNDLIIQTVNKQIDTKRQEVLQTGLSTAVFQLQNQQNDANKVLMSMSVKTTVGPKLDDASIKQAVAGKKAAQAEALIGEYPGVKKVEVEYGPFWVSSIPKNTEKITIIYKK